MYINLTKLITNISKEILIDDTVILEKEYLKNTDIKDISKIKIKGKIVPFNDNFELVLNIKCTLILTCSVTLKDIKYSINININDIIGEDNGSEKLEENNKIINNTIDLIPIIWQNILLEVPLKVVSPGIDYENIKGDGWKLITEEKVDNEDIDPRLEKLKDFLSE